MRGGVRERAGGASTRGSTSVARVSGGARSEESSGGTRFQSALTETDGPARIDVIRLVPCGLLKLSEPETDLEAFLSRALFEVLEDEPFFS